MLKGRRSGIGAREPLMVAARHSSRAAAAPGAGVVGSEHQNDVGLPARRPHRAAAAQSEGGGRPRGKTVTPLSSPPKGHRMHKAAPQGKAAVDHRATRQPPSRGFGHEPACGCCSKPAPTPWPRQQWRPRLARCRATPSRPPSSSPRPALFRPGGGGPLQALVASPAAGAPAGEPAAHYAACWAATTTATCEAAARARDAEAFKGGMTVKEINAAFGERAGELKKPAKRLGPSTWG